MKQSIAQSIAKAITKTALIGVIGFGLYVAYVVAKANGFGGVVVIIG